MGSFWLKPKSHSILPVNGNLGREEKWWRKVRAALRNKLMPLKMLNKCIYVAFKTNDGHLSRLLK